MIPPTNHFKQRLQDATVQLGLWQALGSPYTAEICATAGYDWLLFDGEHAPNDMPGLLAQLQAISAYGVEAVARLPVGEPWMIKQYLDIGFQTLLVPFVESGAQAEALVRATRYGPRGVRGVAPGITRAGRWGQLSGYLQQADSDVCLLVQIESVEGFSRIEEIAAIDGVDGVFIGPADLSAAFGHLGEPSHAEMVARISEGFSRIAAAGKASGTIALTPEAFDLAVAHSCRFVAIGTDVGLLTRGADALLASHRVNVRRSIAVPTAY